MRDDDSDDDVYITDEAKYNALVESRKNRRAVSYLHSDGIFEFK